MKQYRNLKEEELARSEHQSCCVENWDDVLVTESFSSENIHQTRFSGKNYLGVFTSDSYLL